MRVKPSEIKRLVDEAVDGRVNATELWVLTGRQSHLRTTTYLLRASVKKKIKELSTPDYPAVMTGRGRNGATMMHIDIFLGYANWVSGKPEGFEALSVKPSKQEIENCFFEMLKNPNEEGMYSAKDFWQRCGGEHRARPHYFLRTSATKLFIEQVYGAEEPYKVAKGFGSDTLMRRQLFVGYALWFSPEIQSLVVGSFLNSHDILSMLTEELPKDA